MNVFMHGERRSLPSGFEEFLMVADTAIVSIDLHQGHLADTPDCPCPAPGAREIVERVNRFHAAACTLGVHIIHVTSVPRREGSDDVSGIKSASRFVFLLHVGPIPYSDQHAIQGSRWTQFVTEVAEGAQIVETKKAPVGLLSDRSGFPLPPHGREPARSKRLRDRTLHSQQRLRRQQLGISRYRCARARSRHECGNGRRGAEK